MFTRIWLNNLCGQWSWYRKWRGGHWELWPLPDGKRTAWLEVGTCFYVRALPPDPQLFGLPKACEHRWPRHNYHWYFLDMLDQSVDMPCPVCRQLFSQHPYDSFASEKTGIPYHRTCMGTLVGIRKDKPV